MRPFPSNTTTTYTNSTASQRLYDYLLARAAIVLKLQSPNVADVANKSTHTAAVPAHSARLALPRRPLRVLTHVLVIRTCHL